MVANHLVLDVLLALVVKLKLQHCGVADFRVYAISLGQTAILLNLNFHWVY
jgi:hypothetical protein